MDGLIDGNNAGNCSLPDMHMSLLGDLGKAGKGEKAGSGGKSQKPKAPDPLELRVEQGFLSLLILFYCLNMKI